MDELSRQAYQELPQGTYTQKIKGIRKPKVQTQEVEPQRPEGIVKPTIFIDEDKLNKVLLPEYSSDGIKVYSINGEAIRNTVGDQYIGDRKGIDFTMGGHYGVYWNLIPYNEVWVEENLDKDGIPPVVSHEISERTDMLLDKKDYGDAHDTASEVEMKARNSPDTNQELIRKEIAEYEERIRKQKETTDENSDGMRYVAGYYRKPKPIERRETPSNIVAGFKPKYYLGRRVRGSGLASSI
jgi:hypothetical protein